MSYWVKSICLSICILIKIGIYWYLFFSFIIFPRFVTHAEHHLPLPANVWISREYNFCDYFSQTFPTQSLLDLLAVLEWIIHQYIPWFSIIPRFDQWSSLDRSKKSDWRQIFIVIHRIMGKIPLFPTMGTKKKKLDNDRGNYFKLHENTVRLTNVNRVTQNTHTFWQTQTHKANESKWHFLVVLPWNRHRSKRYFQWQL